MAQIELKEHSADNASEEKLLSDFFQEFHFQALAEIEVHRYGKFSNVYRKLATQFKTYFLRESGTTEAEGYKENILGVASFLMKDLCLEGAPQKVAFGRDLRILQNRKAITEWSQHFLPVMEDIKEKMGVKHFFSVLSLSEAQALNAFVRPRSVKRRLPNYHLYRRYNLTSIHGRLPWTKKPLSSLNIRKAQNSDLAPLLEYIVKKSHERELFAVWDQDSFLNKLKIYDQSLLDFYIVFDADQKICGCTLPISQAGVQGFIPLKYSLRAHNFRQFLKFGKWLGWTRPLTKPYSRTGEHLPLEFQYLTFLNADNGDILESLIGKIFDGISENEFLVYTQPRGEFMLRPPESWVSAQIPFGLYLMLAPDQEVPLFLHPSFDKTVELEPLDLI